MVIEMGRISVAISDELEKELRFKTIERFGGKKGDLSRAVEEAIKTWVVKEK
ncbi:MAG: ribbon-helix-helix domain-containing protein [Candidatus Bathyarchaeota archaeon]